MSWRRLGMAAGLLALAGVVGALVLMAVNLVLFARAEVCGSTPSRTCVQVSTGTITSPGRRVDSSWCGAGPATACVDRVRHSIVVTPEGSTREVELWDKQEHPDFVVGDAVRLERWHGQYIAVTDGGQRVAVNGWNPRVLAVLLVLAPISALVIGLLWRFKALSLEDRARLSTVLGALVLIYLCGYLTFLYLVAVPSSARLLYLR